MKQANGRVVFGSNYAFTGITLLQDGAIRLDVEGTVQIDLAGTRQTVAQLAGGSTTASVNIDGGSLTLNQATSTVFAGSITGNGALIKTGSGLRSKRFTNSSSGICPAPLHGNAHDRADGDFRPERSQRPHDDCQAAGHGAPLLVRIAKQYFHFTPKMLLMRTRFPARADRDARLSWELDHG